MVKEIFQLRLEGKAYNTIALYLKKKYKKTIELNYTAQRIHKIVCNKFYY
ncbi:recombinase family protein [Sulfurimonas sp.]